MQETEDVRMVMGSRESHDLARLALEVTNQNPVDEPIHHIFSLNSSTASCRHHYHRHVIYS